MIIREDYLEAAAKAITGFEITVRHRKPAIVGTWGICHQSVEGERFIDLNPFMPREKYFHAFLHECGHWKLNNGEMLRSDVNRLGSDAVDLSEFGKSEEAKAEELAVDELAEKWNAWAEERANKNLFLMCPELAKAIELTRYQTT